MSISPRYATDTVEITGSTAADVVERTKILLRSTDDRLRVARVQLERSRKLLERFADLETDLKRRMR